MANRPADIPCIPNPECRFYGNCFEDVHHIYKQADARTKLEKAFCRLAINQVVLCREVHVTLEAELGWPEYPSREVMQAEVDRGNA